MRIQNETHITANRNETRARSVIDLAAFTSEAPRCNPHKHAETHVKKFKQGWQSEYVFTKE